MLRTFPATFSLRVELLDLNNFLTELHLAAVWTHTPTSDSRDERVEVDLTLKTAEENLNDFLLWVKPICFAPFVGMHVAKAG